MNKVFLYDNNLHLGKGLFSSVGGFRLVSSGFNQCLEAIRDKDNKIYGYIYDITDGLLDALDTYYGTGINLHKRILIQATLAGSKSMSAFMYEYNMELVK